MNKLDAIQWNFSVGITWPLLIGFYEHQSITLFLLFLGRLTSESDGKSTPSTFLRCTHQALSNGMLFGLWKLILAKIVRVTNLTLTFWCSQKMEKIFNFIFYENLRPGLFNKKTSVKNSLVFTEIHLKQKKLVWNTFLEIFRHFRAFLTKNESD